MCLRGSALPVPAACVIQKDMAIGVEHIELKPETIQAFDSCVADAERAMDTALQSGPFLWCSLSPDRLRRVRKGEVVAEYFTPEQKGPSVVPHALIHDWIGAVFVPGVTVQQAIALVQDYDNHKNIYKPEVADSRLVQRTGDDFQIYLRLLKKKIITVVLDTYHDVHYSSPSPQRAWCRSHTTRILEVENAGSAKETTLPPDTGYGFLWRLYSYWWFEKTEEGVFVECRAISLTRDVPAALAWVINPMVRKLPKESLIRTLESTRDALASVAASS